MRAVSAPLVLAIIALGSLTAPRFASADWPPCGRAISMAPNGQVHSVIAPDGAGGAIIAWQDLRSRTINVFAQHVLFSGELDAAWAVDGQALLTDSLAAAGADGGQFTPVIVTDGAGGAIVAWQDFRSATTDGDIFAQHIFASGAVDGDWKVNGTALCEIEGLQNTPSMVSDGAGGAIVTWVDGRPGASVKDIYAQHLLATGVVDPRWPEDGLAVCTAPKLQEFPAIVEDGAGGAIITWEDSRSSTTGVDIFAHHVLNSGVVDRGWPVDGRALCTAGGDQGGPTIASDGAQGAIVAWSDSRIVGTAHIFAQHAIGSGAVDPAWPTNGRAISNAAAQEGRPRAVSDGQGGAIVNWQGFTVELNMYVQHVTATGVVDPAWPVGGRALSDSDRQQTFADIVPDGAGGAVIAWGDSFDVVAQHVLASGALDLAYPATGRVMCNLPSTQGDVALVATGGGGTIVAWTDTRNSPDVSPDIFALQVLAAGTLDVPRPVPPGVTFAHPSPNPARGPLVLHFALSHEVSVKFAIYDMAGRRVRGLISGSRPAGEHAVTWDLRDERGQAVRAGLYFARLEAQGLPLTQKLVALR